MDATDPVQSNTPTSQVPEPASVLASTGAGNHLPGLNGSNAKNKNWLNWVLLGAVFVSLVALLVNIDRSLFVAPQATDVTKDATMKVEMKTTGTIAVGDEFTVLVTAKSPSQKMYGADIVLQYDKNVLEYVSASVPEGVANGCSATADPAVVLAPVKSVEDCAFNNQAVKDQAISEGVVRFGAVSFLWNSADNTNYEPEGFLPGTDQKLAEVTFRAKTAGSSNLTLVHTAGQTNDSNVGVINNNQTVGDALETTTNASATVADGGGDNPVDLSGNSTVDAIDFELWKIAFRCKFDEAIAEADPYNHDCQNPGGDDYPEFAILDADFNSNGDVDFDDLEVIKAALK